MNEFEQKQFVEEEGMTLQELFKIVWINKFIIVFITFWITVIGAAYTFGFATPVYTSETSLIVQVNTDVTETSEQTAISISQNLIATYKEFVVSDLVLESVIEDIEGLPADYSTESLKNSISITTQSGVLIIYISVDNESPELAMEIANELVENSMEIANDDENGYVLLQNKLKLLDDADLPLSPTSPNKGLNVVISVILGLIVALAYVFIKEVLNNKFSSTSEMEKYLGIKVIAAVPGTIKERKLVD